MTVEVYSSAGILVKTFSVDCSHPSGAEFFEVIENARTIKIYPTCVAYEDLYIGGVAIGMAVDFPKPVAVFDVDMDTKAKSDTSSDGQTSVQYIEPLDAYSLRFRGVPRDYFHEIRQGFKSVGTGHIWVDITEKNHLVYQPLYCTSKMIENPTRDRFVSFGLTLTEAR